MARRNYKERLIDIQDIHEEMRLIAGSETDYITPTGNIYKEYEKDKYFKKSVFINKENGYAYCNISFPEGTKQRRVHRLVAIAFLPNPNNYPIVMHKDNDKENPRLENLEWDTVSKNTKDAYKDGLAKNDEGFNDSQSIPVCVFNIDQELLEKCGSVSIAAKKYGITKTGILYQCNHKVKTKSRKGYYFRYLQEYELSGFVL